LNLGQQRAYDPAIHCHYWHKGVVVSGPVLFAYSLDGSGDGAALHDGAISRLLKDDLLAWAHLNADHPDTVVWLRREVGYLDDFVVNALLAGSANALREQIVSIRKKAIVFKRYMAPQRDLIAHLLEAKIDWFAEHDHHHMIEAHDNIIRFVEELDSVWERSQVIRDEVTNILTERLNKNMYALSVVAAIFLPLGFLTGLLGINIGGIPGAENPQAFLVFCGMLALVVGLQVLIFRKMRWF
jgi:Mg2+ and Co2+ transporter CorA